MAGRLLRVVLITLAALGLVVLALYLFRAPLLRGAADCWIIDDPVAKADAIVVLGGGVQYRPFEAARLYHAGAAPRVVITQVRLEKSDTMGLTRPSTTVTREILQQQKVPNRAIIVVGTEVASTRDEALAIRDWARTNQVNSLLIPTESFHTRRVRWLFRKTLSPLGIEVRLRAVDPPEYSRSTWWQHEQGLIAFQNEVVKFAYYWLKY